MGESWASWLHKILMKHTSKGIVPHSEILLFPKVVLEGTVKEAMDPAPLPVLRLRKKTKVDEDRPGNGCCGGGGSREAGIGHSIWPHLLTSLLAVYISSFTNSFFPLAQVKKAAKRDKSGRSKKPCG